ncbi:MAG TPA: VWA domain-containing protein [Bacteroidia bacterium]|nr:VWA domain-containing protein [Bacteroidia bacterium]
MNYFSSITFAHPGLFWLMLVIPVLIVFYVFRHNFTTAEVLLPSPFLGIDVPKATYKNYLRHSLFALRMLGIAALIVIVARPQSTMSYKNITSEGIDIVMAQDISGSMLSTDFRPNRIGAAKKVDSTFINDRPDDKIGLVIFSGQAFTQCPLTTDHAVIKNLLAQIHTGMVEDGTAIGDGLATAVNRLKDDNTTKSKVIILLTDGVNNMGSVAPLTAAEIAKVFNIRVYTIGVGTIGKAMTPDAIMPNGQYHYSLQDVEIDEPLLRQIASMTGGKYFRATDNESLKKIYSEIDKMEKSRITEKDYTDRAEEFLPFAIAAGILLLLELLLKNTVLRTVP